MLKRHAALVVSLTAVLLCSDIQEFRRHSLRLPEHARHVGFTSGRLRRTRIPVDGLPIAVGA